jgi:hypothetical protein
LEEDTVLQELAVVAAALEAVPDTRVEQVQEPLGKAITPARAEVRLEAAVVEPAR